MATVKMTSENAESLIINNQIVLVDFYADWCQPCKRFAPIFEALSETHKDLIFAKVDTEAQQELAAMFEIKSIPTIAAFKEQKMIFLQPGMLPEQAMEELISKIKELDLAAAVKAAEAAVVEEQK